MTWCDDRQWRIALLTFDNSSDIWLVVTRKGNLYCVPIVDDPCVAAITGDGGVGEYASVNISYAGEGCSRKKNGILHKLREIGHFQHGLWESPYFWPGFKA